MTQGAGLWAKGKSVLEEPTSSHLGSGLPCVDISLVLLLCELLGGTCTHHSTVPMSPLWRVIKGQIHAAVHVSGVLGGLSLSSISQGQTESWGSCADRG